MAIPGPGTAISMNTIATEFGGTVPHSLSEYYRGGGLVPNIPANNAIPTSGQIAMGNFYGSTSRIAVNLTISANTQNYDVYANRGPSYTAGISDITVTVNPGIIVGSSSIPAYAMLVPSAFNPADTVTIVNNGVIQGMGGSGGSGAPLPGTTPGNPGGSGGNAIFVNRPTTITNNGTVAGGGGGGGGGGAFSAPPILGGSRQGGGGGGGAGNNAGSGGAAGGGTAQAGGPGSSAAGGSGGAGATGSTPGGPGGAGGGRGAVGTAGTTRSGSGGGGGAGGNYIVGNPFVTWPVTGTRQGGVA